MSSEKTEALVIRLADFSESSRVATLFTREFGKISALAKGAKRLKSAFEAALDLLTECRIVFLRKSSGSLDLLTEAKVIQRFQPTSRELTPLYAGYYVAELLNGLTEDYDPHPLLYDQARHALDEFTHQSDVRIPLLTFEINVLQEIGQFPELDQCVVCGVSTENGGNFAYWAAQGGVICSRCRHEEYSKNTSLHAGSLALLRRLAEGTAVSSRLKISPQQFQEMRSLATSAITHALDRRPKMLRYLQF